MDTNGRRNDVINALQGYLTILDDIQNEQKMNWASMPESLAQYEFYRQAIELSPEVFGKHGPYDKLAETLERNKDFATAVQTQDMESFFYSVSTTIDVHILQNFAKICILCTEMTNT